MSAILIGRPEWPGSLKSSPSSSSMTSAPPTRKLHGCSASWEVVPRRESAGGTSRAPSGAQSGSPTGGARAKARASFGRYCWRCSTEHPSRGGDVRKDVSPPPLSFLINYFLYSIYSSKQTLFFFFFV